jgi:penicillin amidase
MITALAALALLQTHGAIVRDPFGVPRIMAPSPEAAMRLMGQAVAEDRLWQMELSRRLAHGRLAAALGPAAQASDVEVLAESYTEEELQRQIDRLPSRVRRLWTAYAEGVNAHIARAQERGALPPGYAANGFEPEPWTLVDSAAIAVRLARLFGTGGRGELRNYAMLLYLRTQPAQDQVLDVFDDLAWQNDRRAIPTVHPEDDPLARNPPAFPAPSRRVTEAHLARLPPTSLLELAPAIRIAAASPSQAFAMNHGLPSTWGSYAIVVSARRSRLGVPLLLGGPEMGHSSPSVVHEAALDAPGLRVHGMNVPGVPGVLIGKTPYLAWTLTTSVADTADIFVNRLDGDEIYMHGAERKPIQRIVRRLEVRDRPSQEVVQRRTHLGPVVLTSRVGNAVYSVRASFWMRELAAFGEIFALYTATSLDEVDPRARAIPLGFNLFVATAGGETGWWYCGLMPVRAPGFDPRLPLPGEPEADWRGFLRPDQMPRLRDPRSGLIANWNNKPAAWWPNLDTPAWGRLFRNQELLRAIPEGRLGPSDLERTAWTIARRAIWTQSAFMPLASRSLALRPDMDATARLALQHLLGFDGWNTEGSIGARVYAEFVRALRREVFEQHVGGMVTPEVFVTVLQPSVLLDALEGRTRFPYLAGRRPEEVARAAFDRAVRRLTAQYGADPAAWAFVSSRISVPGADPIPYAQRGTFLQIVELTRPPRGRSVLSPGNAETGPHATDQAALARAWMYKPMTRFGGP